MPKRGKTKRSSISKHPEIIPIREIVDKAHKAYTESLNNYNKEKWKTALQELYDTYERIREEEAMQKIEQIENAMDGQRFREAWKAVNELSGRKNAKDGQVAGESPEERINTWFTQFRKLLGNTPEVEEPDETIPAVYEGLDFDDGPFTLDEFKRVKTSLKLGKSAGPDGIPPEVFKCCDFDDICLNFCNKVLMQCDKPPQWSFMNIIPVPKSGDLSVTDNYRGISRTCIMAKIFNRLLLNRIREVPDLKIKTDSKKKNDSISNTCHTKNH